MRGDRLTTFAGCASECAGTEVERQLALALGHERPQHLLEGDAALEFPVRLPQDRHVAERVVDLVRCAHDAAKDAPLLEQPQVIGLEQRIPRLERTRRMVLLHERGGPDAAEPGTQGVFVDHARVRRQRRDRAALVCGGDDHQRRAPRGHGIHLATRGADGRRGLV